MASFLKNVLIFPLLEREAIEEEADQLSGDKAFREKNEYETLLKEARVNYYIACRTAARTLVENDIGAARALAGSMAGRDEILS